MSSKWILAAAILVLAGARPAGAEELGTLAAELARLRSEIEALSREIDARQDEERARLRGLHGQQAELEAEISREQLRWAQLETAMREHRTELAAAGAGEGELEAPVLRAIAELRAWTERGLPFQTRERLEALAALERQVRHGSLPPSRALQRVWERMEDELRLTRESGLHPQVIEVQGREVLAEVARIGMVMLFFRTPDGGAGRAVQQGGRWIFEPYTAPEPRERVQALFADFRRQIRVGRFELPNALAGSGGEP